MKLYFFCVYNLKNVCTTKNAFEEMTYSKSFYHKKKTQINVM